MVCSLYSDVFHGPHACRKHVLPFSRLPSTIARCALLTAFLLPSLTFTAVFTAVRDRLHDDRQGAPAAVRTAAPPIYIYIYIPPAFRPRSPQLSPSQQCLPSFQLLFCLKTMSCASQVIFEGSRDRRQIKNKFKREERENPTSVDQALITQFKE